MLIQNNIVIKLITDKPNNNTIYIVVSDISKHLNILAIKRWRKYNMTYP